MDVDGVSKKYLSEYGKCHTCGGNLHVRHQTDFSRNLTEEISQCPECGAAPKSILHRLQ